MIRRTSFPPNGQAGFGARVVVPASSIVAGSASSVVFFTSVIAGLGPVFLRPVMTWIKTVPLSEANQQLLQALQSQHSLYPQEYADPVFKMDSEVAGIVGSHSLIPQALHHAFSTFGVLLSPELPLTRRQHEMITTMVSVTNRCFY